MAAALTTTSPPAPIGYGAVAAAMDADTDLAIYRRYGALNARNILYLQSELLVLEERLQQLDVDADGPGNSADVRAVPRSWYNLEKQHGEHLEVVMLIRDRLEKYNQALQAQAWLLALKKPSPKSLSVLVEFMKFAHTLMLASDAKFVAPEHQSDLVALVTNEKEPLSLILEKHMHWLFKSKDRSTQIQNTQLEFFSEKKIKALVRLLALVVSSLLPVLSILGLYFIPSQNARLGCIVAFSALGSALLALLTNAGNIQIITATAAYAAVQVVFVSGDLPTSPGSATHES